MPKGGRCHYSAGLIVWALLESGNDAAIALAEYCSGSVEEFAKLMNSTAKSFGATNSNFVKPKWSS